MKKLRGALWGLVLVALGVLLLLNALELLSFDIFFTGWWTLFIIVPSVVGVITEREKTGSVITLCIGVALLLCSRGVLQYALLWKLLLPIIVVVIGLRLLWGSLRGQKRQSAPAVAAAGAKTVEAVFDGSRVSYADEVFEGATLRAVFGGVECDLRNALLEKDVTVTATAVFGGVTLYVPQGVHLQVTSTSVCGGVSDHTEKTAAEHTLYLQATCVFGGVDVKH